MKTRTVNFISVLLIFALFISPMGLAENLSDEVSIADAFQAKIIGDFFDSDFGWKLSKVFES